MEAQKRMIKQFHTLLSNAGMNNDDKRAILAAYGVESTKALNLRELHEICDKITNLMRGSTCAEFDKLRKRVIRAIFRNLELKNLGQKFSVDYVKGIACRAAGCKSFNKIDINTLRGIYNAFCKQNEAFLQTNYQSFKNNNAQA